VVLVIIGCCSLGIVALTLPETHAPTLLYRKAQMKRKETGDDRYYAPIEKRDITLSSMVKIILEKPFKMLAHEPMLLVVTIYMSVSPDDGSCFESCRHPIDIKTDWLLSR